METLNKRETKHSDKTQEPEPKFRMNQKFQLMVGDDTGLIKQVSMTYSYQTDIIGSYMKANLDEENLEETLKKQKHEEFSLQTKTDHDGQPLFK